MNYNTWHKLNEALGFPLGITNATSLGVTNTFQLDEKKMESKKKKMDLDGGEIDVSDSDDDDGDDDDMDSDDSAPMISKKPVDGDCDCDKVPMMMKKKMKKDVKKESLFDGSYEARNEVPEVGSDEFRDYFFKSINSHFQAPANKNWSGVNLGEEVLFEPSDNDLPVTQSPKAGEVGFAPTAPVGGYVDQPAQPAAWEAGWTKVAEQFIRDAGLTASFQEWAKSHKK